MAAIIIVLLIPGLSALLYFMGTIVRAFAVVASAVFASILAFACFESLAGILISNDIMGSWANSFAFLSLLIIAFAVLFTITWLLTRSPVEFGLMPERIGRVICGIIAGFILSGSILAGLSMAPWANTSPYQRFDPANPNVGESHMSLLNADGFATALFSFESNGSLGGSQSFSVLHPNFLNQAFLNRLKTGIPFFTSSQAIDVPNKAAIWPAPQDLKDAGGKPLTADSGCKLMIARIGIKQGALRDAGNFAFSQLRLVCKEKGQTSKPLAGKGINIYPVGYINTLDKVKTGTLLSEVKLESADFGGAIKWLDFVFDVPENFVPVLAEFKQNNVAEIGPPVTAEQAPSLEPFIPYSDCATDIVQVQPTPSAPVYGIELACGEKLLNGLILKIADMQQWQAAQTKDSIKPAEFAVNKIIQTQAELLIKESNPENKTKEPSPALKQTTKKTATGAKGKPVKGKYVKSLAVVGNLFRTLKNYQLVSLKCNNPATGAELKGQQLPVLVEASGLTHCPVGVIASGKVDDQTIYEVDYCSMLVKPDSNSGCLEIAEKGNVEKPFPDSVWLTEKTKSISEFYTLYLVKTVDNPIITAVKPSSSSPPAGLVKYDGFAVK